MTARTSGLIYRSPTPLKASKAAILDFAERQRRKARLQNGFQLPDLIAANNGRIDHIGIMTPNQEDAMVIEPDGSFVIRVSTLSSALRNHFIIAYELGHWLLHWPAVQSEHAGCGMRTLRKLDEADEDQVRCAWEARWFAEAFLMPSDEFEDVYEDGTASARFGVSPAAVARRAASLKVSRAQV